jgi:molybdopterin synthase catalytic subunit
VSATVVLAGVGPEPIDAAQVLARVGGEADGAAILFIGTVRDHNDGRPVRGVFYEAYEEMATKVLAEVAAEACAKMEGGQLAVVHRTGELAIGELSVAIAVSSPHRAAAYDASRYVIEEIKKRLPVWKHERYVDGDARWLAGSDPTAGMAQADGDSGGSGAASRPQEKATR